MQKSRRTRDEARHKWILVMDWMETIDLAKRVLDFLRLELQWIASARHVWMVDAVTGDAVTVFMELYDGSIVEQPLEVPRNSILLEVETSGEDIAMQAFIESRGLIKKLSYGMDIETLRPKRVLDNPFFGLKSTEEIAMKLDLLGGDGRGERKRRRETIL